MTENSPKCSRISNSPPSISIGTLRPDSASWPRIRLSFHSSVVNVPRYHNQHFYRSASPPRLSTADCSPSAALLTYPRFLIDSSSLTPRFRLSCRLLSQGQVCNLHYPFSLVKSVPARLLLSSARSRTTKSNCVPGYLLLPTIYSLLSTYYYLLTATYSLLSSAYLLPTSSHLTSHLATSMKGHSPLRQCQLSRQAQKEMLHYLHPSVKSVTLKMTISSVSAERQPPAAPVYKLSDCSHCL